MRNQEKNWEIIADNLSKAEWNCGYRERLRAKPMSVELEGAAA